MKKFLIFGFMCLIFVLVVSGAGSLDSFDGDFFEGFESGSLVTNNWTTSGAGAAWVVGNGEATPRTGIYNIWIENTGAESLIETGVSTENYQNITFSFWGLTDALDSSEYLAADWYNGTSWINLMQVEDIATYTFYSYSLTTDANNNPNFKIRFRCLSSANNEDCDVDDINISGTKTIDVTLYDYYGLNGSFDRIDEFNTSNLEEIEHMELNFSVDSTETIDSWYLNFTANGTNGCSLGNKQSQVCYAYPNWIQFVEGVETATFDGTQENSGDRILVTQAGSGSSINLSFRIDEHYNPSVFKWYDALYNFSDVKWQDGVSQKITGNNFIKVELNSSLIPIDADQYKLDFRVNATGSPIQPLEVYFCNSSYVSGNPHDFASCLFVDEQMPSTFKDDGTKFRTIYTNSTMNGLGNVRYVILYTAETNASKYYSLKTYKVRAPAYTTHWEYSNDSGSNWANLGDGYETELNINWFHNYANPTAFIYNLWVNTTSGAETNLVGNITWDIDPLYNYPPAPHIHHPEGGEVIRFPYNVTFALSDPNDDNLNASLYLYKDGSWNKTLAMEMNQSNTSYLWDDSTVDGSYSLILEVCELGTSDLYCVNSSHVMIVDNTVPAVYNLIPTAGSEFNVTDVIEIGANVTDGIANGVLARVTYPNSTIVEVVLTVAVGDKYNNSFTIPDLTGRYNVTFVANDSAGNSNNSETTYFIADGEDSCNYSGSGNWEVDCWDNCVISSNVDLLGNNISIVGSGSFSTTANITNFLDLYIEGTNSVNRCEVFCSGGGCFR